MQNLTSSKMDLQKIQKQGRDENTQEDYYRMIVEKENKMTTLHLLYD